MLLSCHRRSRRAGCALLQGACLHARCHSRRLDSRLPHRSMNRNSSPAMRCACHKAREKYGHLLQIQI